MKNCPNCGHENMSDAHFCEECGQAFVAEPAETTRKNRRFCPNCRKAVETDAAFCWNCGYPLNATGYTKARVRNPLSRKQKIGIGSGLVLLISGFLFCCYYYSYPQQLNRLAQIFKTQDLEKIAAIVVSEDPKYQVSATELEKFVSYYQEDSHKADFADFLTDLKNDPGQLEDFSLQQSGKHLGLFPRYQLVIQPVYLTVTANQADMQLSLDDKQQATSTGSNYQTTWGPLTPGSYRVEGKLKNAKSAATQELMRYHNSEFETDSQVVISLHKISFKVTSNIEGAKVLLNDKEVATIKNGQAEVKNVAWHQGFEVQLVANSGRKQLKSDTYQIADARYLADEYDANSQDSEIRLDFEKGR